MKKKTASEEAADAKERGWVFLKKAPGGGWRAKWYGRYMKNGRTRETSLCPWQGTPPANPAKEEGNAAFERSRERAEKLLKDAMGKWGEADEELRDARKIYAMRYGRTVRRVKLEELAARWDALPHKAGLTQTWRDLVHTVLSRFVGFMGEKFPAVKDAAALTAEHFKAFFDFVDGLGLSARAWNYHLSILRGVLAKVDGASAGFRDYLAALPKRAETTVHRRPFSGEELEAVFAAAARIDPELHPVIVTAACTALRRGDAARLRWESVDFADGFVTVKTTKTGETVEIPIFPPLLQVLRRAEAEKRPGVPYVFPKIALAYKADMSALDRRLRKVLEAAGFARPALPKKGNGKPNPNAYKYPAPPTPGDAVAMVDAGMRGSKWTERRRQKGLAVLQRHLQGEDGRTIARALGVGKSSVSEYLHAMERVGEVALVSPPKVEEGAKSTLAEVRDGEQRKHRGSLCGWHSFRTTFCSLALANGVPMELLRRITGHRTAEIVEKHYNRAKREEARRAFGAAMPSAIAGAVEASMLPEAPVADVPAAGGEGEEVEMVAVRADVAKAAEMLAGADAETLAKVAELLAKAKGAK